MFLFLETRLRTRTGRPVVCSDQNHAQVQSRGMFNVLNDVDLVPSNVQFSHQEAVLHVFEDNKAVIKIIIKGRSLTMRHVSRTTELLLIGCSIDPKIQIKYIDTKNQLPDTLTKGNFTRDEWNHLLCLLNISHFSSIDCSEGMSKRTSKRTQEESGEERVTAKSRPMMSLIARAINSVIFCIRKQGGEKL